MSLSVVALGVALLVVPRWYAVLSVTAGACAVAGFAVVFAAPEVAAGGTGVLVVGATSALVVGVLALCEGLVAELSFAPGEFRVADAS